MFKKIHFNRNPRDTVGSELRRELAPYLDRLCVALRSAASRYTRLIFWIMVITMACSAGWTFTHMTGKTKQQTTGMANPVWSHLTGGMDQIMQTGRALNEMFRLSNLIDSLAVKKQMTAQDSALLEKALDRFQQIHKTYNPKP